MKIYSPFLEVSHPQGERLAQSDGPSWVGFIILPSERSRASFWNVVFYNQNMRWWKLSNICVRRLKWCCHHMHNVFTLTTEYGDMFHSANTYCTFFECTEIVLEGQCCGGTCGWRDSLYCWLASPRPPCDLIVFISVRSCWITDWSSFISFSPSPSKFCKLSTLHGLLHCFEWGCLDLVPQPLYLHFALRIFQTW
jgi:hypothetical protein